MNYPFSKEDVIHNEADNMIRKQNLENEEYFIEHCLTPFKDPKVFDIIKSFQDNPDSLDSKFPLSRLLCDCIMRFNQYKK